MAVYPTIARRTLALSLAVLLSLPITGCETLTRVLTPVPGATPTATPTTPRPPTATVTPTATPAGAVASPQPRRITLTLWTIEALGPIGEVPGAQELAAQIEAFEKANPDIRVEVVRKKPYGKGGMLDFLTTTKAAVPSGLPDIAVLNTRELGVAARRQLIQPLEGQIEDELIQDLVGAARSGGRVNDTWYGLPFVADVEHLIYNTSLVSPPPVTWTDVLSGTAQYLFPAGGQAAATGQANVVNDAFVIQYLAAGGRFTDEAGRPTVDRLAVAQVLSFYADGLALGVIPENILEYRNLDDVWPVYLAEEVAMANTSASRYLAGRQGFRKSSFAAVPTHTGVATTLADMWAYVLVTDDPGRQAAAWSLIRWLMEPQHLGPWALAAYRLPTRLSALPDTSDDEYLKFVTDLLLRAQMRPRDPYHIEAGRALQEAVEAVVTGSASPEEAAARAVAALQ
jgi:ABC-type glycerol-3-phosphate transport system substrate-binding protein